MLINLAPLYSRLANSSAIAGVSWHQQATWDLLSDPTVDAVIKDEVETAIKAHLIVGTSTLDVGVDFKINFLIFEGHDASTFIQRLGRLGRHEGFPIYRGYALIPNYLEARIAKTLANDWQAEEWSGDRIAFNKVEAIVANRPIKFNCKPILRNR
jgi:CRISPR/Cas system-associated endonuclease/helicase Cas3